MDKNYKNVLKVLPYSNLGQHISPDEHAKFMKNFGDLDIHLLELFTRTLLPLSENPKI